MESYSQVVSMKYSFDKIFGEFGKNTDYVFNIIYNLDNIMELGVNSVNVVIINGEIPQEQIPELKKYHINHNAWKDDMVAYVKTPEVIKKTISEFFDSLPEEFKKRYLNKWPKP